VVYQYQFGSKFRLLKRLVGMFKRFDYSVHDPCLIAFHAFPNHSPKHHDFHVFKTSSSHVIEKIPIDEIEDVEKRVAAAAKERESAVDVKFAGSPVLEGEGPQSTAELKVSLAAEIPKE